MCRDRMDTVWKLPITATQKLVLLKLADCFREEVGYGWPTLKDLCDDCSLSRRCVIEKIGELTGLGYVQVDRTQRESNRYVLTGKVPKKSKNDRGAPRAPQCAKVTPDVTLVHGGGAPGAPGGVHHVHPSNTVISTVTVPLQVQGTGKCVNGELIPKVEWLRERLSCRYKAKGVCLGETERQMAALVTRPDIEAEADEIIWFFDHDKKPCQTLRAVIEAWDHSLERAHSLRQILSRPPDMTKKDYDQKIAYLLSEIESAQGNVEEWKRLHGQLKQTKDARKERYGY